MNHTRRKRIRSEFFILVASFLGANVFAGEVVVSKTTTKTVFGTVSGKQVLYAEGPSLRMETHVKGKLKSVTIFNAAKKEMIAYNVGEKKYTVVTSAQMKQMAEAASRALKNLQAQMKPKDRQMMQVLKKSLTGSQSSTKTEFKLAKKASQVGEFKCDLYEGFRGGQRVSAMCLRSDSWFSSVSRSLKRVRKTKMRIYKAFAGSTSLAKQFGFEKMAYSKVNQKSYPILYETNSGLGKTSVQVVSVQSKSLKPSLFNPPKGYRKQQMKRTALF